MKKLIGAAVLSMLSALAQPDSISHYSGDRPKGRLRRYPNRKPGQSYSDKLKQHYQKKGGK